MRALVATALAGLALACGSPAPTAVSSPAPTSTPTPAALFTQAGTTSIDLAGPFTTTGSWWLAWAYDCSAVTNGHDWLIIAVYRQSDADSSTAALFDTITPVPGAADAGSASGEASESRPTTAGPPAGIFFLKITSECSWHVVARAA